MVEPPLPDAGRVASAFAEAWAQLGGALEQGWVRQGAGLQVVVTEMPVPTLNGVWVLGQEADRQTVEAGLRMVEDAQIPFCLQARPGWTDQASMVAEALGMVQFEEVPLMAATGPVLPSAPQDLSIRPLGEDEALVHCQIAGGAFGASTELFAQLMTERVMALKELQAYVVR